MNETRSTVRFLTGGGRFPREDGRGQNRTARKSIGSRQNDLFRFSLAMTTLTLILWTRGMVLGQPNDSERLPPAWLPEADELLVALDYPTRRAAALSAGRHIRDGLERLSPSAGAIIVVPGEPPVSAEDFAAVVASIQAEWPDRKVRVAGSTVDVAKGEISVSVRSNDDATTIRMDLLGPASEPDKRASVLIRHSDAKWITGEEELGDNQQIARSERLAEYEDAKTQCRENAVALLLPIASEQAKRVFVDEGPFDELPMELRTELKARIARIEVDEVSQAFLMKDGSSAFRVAMLLDVDRLPDVIAEIRADYMGRIGGAADHRHQFAGRRRDSSEHASYAGRLVSLIGLVIGVTMTYCMLDGVTKGFYTGWIKAGLSVIGILGFFILLLATRGG